MECTICGAANAPEANFCKACGASLQEPSKEITMVTTQPIQDRFVIKERFKLLKKLGKGGMGEVFLAEDIRLKRRVAVKSILKGGLQDTSTKIRFLREAQAASQLDHTNICTIYEIYEEEEQDYIVMQYIDGVTLDHIIGVKKLSIDKIIDIGIQVCDGMIEAHSKDIMHRDIKPGNIIIDNKGLVKILDFGLAKFTKEAAVKSGDVVESDLTQKGFVMGTVAYISPEQARGKGLDKRTDIFSFGVVLYEMIEGQNPFRVEEQIETLYNVLNKPIEFTRDIPQELKEIVIKALERDREDRYQDFASLKEELEAFKDFYARLKKRKADPRVTEVINLSEQAKILEESQKTSDKENLGEMVDRIKKMKASTERVEPTQRRKLNPLWGIPILVILVLIAAVFLFKKGKETTPLLTEGEKFYIYLHNLEDETGEPSLPEMVDYLLKESLDQFQEFKIVDKETALSMTEYIKNKTRETTEQPGEKGQKKEEVPLELLKDRYNIKFQLTGKIKKIRDSYTIDAYLGGIGQDTKHVLIPATGLKRESFLESQVDLIAEGIYLNIFPKKGNDIEIKKLKKIYGDNWDKFSNFYAGLTFFNRTEYGKAEKFFKNSPDLLISKFYLARVYHVMGKREEALDLIKQIIPSISYLTPFLQAKVRSWEGRLEFKFAAEINPLEKLKIEYPFSKEILFELGEAYFHHANPRKAIEYYNKVLEFDKNYANALNHLGYSYSYMGNHSKAINAFQRYNELDRTANSYDSLGDGYFYYGKLDYAKSMKESAVGQTEDILAYPYQTLADIYILRAEYQQATTALANYRRLEGSKKADAYALGKQAFIHYKEKQYSRALELIDQAVQTHDSKDLLDTTSPEIHWLRGIITVALDNREEAKKELNWLKQFVKKYNLDKDNFKAAFKYFIHLQALSLEKENKTREADETFKSLLAMKDSLSYWITYYYYQFFHTEYARFLRRNKEDEGALAALQECLHFNINYIPALWLKAEILEKLKRIDKAKEAYKKIAELYGDSEEENYLRNRLKEKLNQFPSQ